MENNNATFISNQKKKITDFQLIEFFNKFFEVLQ